MQDGSTVPAKTIIRIPRNDGGAEDFEFEIAMTKTQQEFFFDLTIISKRIESLIQYRIALIRPYLSDQISWHRYMELVDSNDKLLTFWNDHLKKLQA
jgi:hypothetical protein